MPEMKPVEDESFLNWANGAGNEKNGPPGDQGFSTYPPTSPCPTFSAGAEPSYLQVLPTDSMQPNLNSDQSS